MNHAQRIIANWGTSEATAARAIAFDLAKQERGLLACLAVEEHARQKLADADRAGAAFTARDGSGGDMAEKMDAQEAYSAALALLAETRYVTAKTRLEIERLRMAA